MAYVTSRGFRLPDSAKGMSDVWFNVWSRKLWPYNELQSGDELWWYESPTGRLRWKTRVLEVDAFPYSSLDDAISRVDEVFGVTTNRGQDYLAGKPNEGYCVAYRVEAVQRVDVPRPPDLKFNQSGWERGDRPGIAEWIAGT